VPDYKPILGNYKKPPLNKEEEEIRKIWSSARHQIDDRIDKFPPELQELFGRGRKNIPVGGGWPDVPEPRMPASLYPETSGTIAPSLGRLQRIDPEILNSLGPIIHGPNADVASMFADDRKKFGSHFYPQDFERTSLLGLTGNQKKNEIAISPRVLDDGTDLDSLMPVLGHEITHALGHADEKEPENVRTLVRLMLGTDKYKALRQKYATQYAPLPNHR